MPLMRKSVWLLAISTILLLFSALSIFLAMHFTNGISDNAYIINRAGIIRGSMQRAVKLELSGMSDDMLLKSIDESFDSIIENEITMKSVDAIFKKSILDLHSDWDDLKQYIYKFRDNPESMNEHILLKKSEEMWGKSNNTVSAAEYISTQKVSYYKILFIFMCVNIFLVVMIILFLKFYVTDKLEFNANHDPLTAIYNRSFAHKFLSNEIKNMDRGDRNLAVIAFDIDFFKRVNDTYGHDVGDYVLKELTELVKVNIRKFDVFARMGGEEFMLILPFTDVEGAKTLAEKLRKLIESHNFGKAGRVTVSFGVTVYKKGDNVEAIYKRADISLYRAKDNGRNRTEVEE